MISLGCVCSFTQQSIYALFSFHLPESQEVEGDGESEAINFPQISP